MMEDQYPCEEWAEKLAARHQEDLTAQERFLLQEHLANCPACMAQYQVYLALESRVRELPSPEPPPSFLPILRTLREKANMLPALNLTERPKDSSNTSPPEGRRFALVIGVNTVTHVTTSSLSYAERDAQELASVLQQRAGFELVNSPIIGREATRDNILRSLTQLVEECRETDEVIFYYSGHGHSSETESHSRDFKLCPSDCDEEDKAESALSAEHISQLFTEQLKARQVLLILDCCHSGASTKTEASSPSLCAKERLVGYFARSEQDNALALLMSVSGQEAFNGPSENESLSMLLQHALLHRDKSMADSSISNEATDLQQVYRSLEEAIT